MWVKKLVYLKFWATWCQPCREQMPHLQETYESFGDDIEVIAVNIDINDSAEEARKKGETEQRIYALAAWQESPLFSEIERIVLAVTEELTLIADRGLSKELYNKALAILGENKLAQCMMQVVTINAWNRIAIATNMRHEAA